MVGLEAEPPLLPPEPDPEPEPEPEPESEPAQVAEPPAGFRRVELFGGAMSSQICSRFADVSTFRQVPDSQEVFVDTASSGSLTLELLERQGTPLAARFPPPPPASHCAGR